MSPKLANELKGHLLAAKAVKDAMDKSLASANPANVWRFMGFRVYMQTYNQIAIAVSKLVKITVPIGTWKMSEVGSQMDTNAFTQQSYFEGVYTNLNLLISFIEHTIGLKADEIQSLRDFFQVNLRRAIFDAPDKEKQVQDVVEQLLIGRGLSRGVDYDREIGRVKVSINYPAARPQGMNQSNRSCTASGSCPCSRTYFSTTLQFPPSPTVPT